jgi:hypothetical protein
LGNHMSLSVEQKSREASSGRSWTAVGPLSGGRLIHAMASPSPAAKKRKRETSSSSAAEPWWPACSMEVISSGPGISTSHYTMPFPVAETRFDSKKAIAESMRRSCAATRSPTGSRPAAGLPPALGGELLTPLSQRRDRIRRSWNIVAKSAFNGDFSPA